MMGRSRAPPSTVLPCRNCLPKFVPAIDVIVVYKVDLDPVPGGFCQAGRAVRPALRLVRVRSFNTTSSMGRLTLNVLLSFAQFERGEISLFASDWSAPFE